MSRSLAWDGQTGNLRPETGDRRQQNGKAETGKLRPETGELKPETGTERSPETGNRKAQRLAGIRHGCWPYAACRMLHAPLPPAPLRPVWLSEPEGLLKT